jgi:serine/threonine-protein kinase HipA
MVVESRLSVRLAHEHVAELTHERGRSSLRYLAGAEHAVSRRLPVRPDSYPHEACHAFFANLLPEAGFRDGLCRRLALPVEDDFTLLSLLGRDCAGAVSLEPAASRDSEPPSYTPVAEAELREWLAQPLSRPSPERAPGLCCAISGAQDKLVVHLVDGQPYLCERGAPSTVILKPDIAEDFDRIQLSGLNELFCMQLAASVGLRVQATFWFAGAFATQRYDRVASGSSLSRLHQEDFAQLLGRPPTAKYEIGWRHCFELVDQHVPNPEAARRELIDRLFFNLLIGNGDAHGKNFALLFGPEGAKLAPAYDLLCTQAYPTLSESFSMKIGPARRQDELSAQAWQELALEARLPLDWIKERGAKLCSKVQLALRELAPHIVSTNPTLKTDIYPLRRRDDFLAKLADIMIGNCKRVSRTLLARA